MPQQAESNLPAGPNIEAAALLELRHEYAWEWFKYHATQRVAMFNYFLLATGILANAYVGLLKENQRIVAIGLASLGTLTSLAFVLLDSRNKQLVDLGEDVLEKLERDTLFPPGFTTAGDGRSTALGLRSREVREEPKWAVNKRKWFVHNLIQHRVLIRAVEGMIAVFFLLGVIVPTVWPDLLRSKSTSEIVAVREELRRLDQFVRNQLQPVPTKPLAQPPMQLSPTPGFQPPAPAAPPKP